MNSSEQITRQGCAAHLPAKERAGDAVALTEIGRERLPGLGILAPDPESTHPICRPCLN
ncbi:hypothetical protein [Paracoccus nototheniae]|uniref:Uncharacterized protein n=1 Tax=Paracoccus nototheniae TaxID=2489002 RepID=A0ABW4DUH8_9RHOB|nr:hypothetical protein [Paracoccus nototheniae]